MLLKLSHVVRTERNVRSSRDQRVRVIRITAEYTNGMAGEVYRKSFEGKKVPPTVPQVGTHDELNAQRFQW